MDINGNVYNTIAEWRSGFLERLITFRRKFESCLRNQLCTGSSVGQSSRLISDLSLVQVQPCVPICSCRPIGRVIRFKLGTVWVRIPLGVPIIGEQSNGRDQGRYRIVTSSNLVLANHYALLAQLVEALVLGTSQCGFESHVEHQSADVFHI